jgi:hypothetical protein
MTVEITCPNCNFSQILPRIKVPSEVRWATCPRCRHRFEFAPEEPGSPFAENHGETGSATDAGRGPSPWENRSERGTWKGIYETFKGTLFSPDHLFRTMAFQGGMGEPFAFGLLFGTAGAIFSAFWQFLLMSGVLRSIGHQFFGETGLGLLFLGLMIISPVFVILNMFLTSAVLHACLLIVGGGRNGFEATFRVVAYSQATQIIGVIPLAGGVISWLWKLVVGIIGLREIHDTSYGRVILALLLPLGLVFLLGMFALILVLMLT